MGDKLLVAVTPPPKKPPHRATSPKHTNSPIKQPLPSPRTALSPRFGPLSDTLTVPALSAEKGNKPLSKSRSFVFSKSFDETKPKTPVWSPSQSFDAPNSPGSPLAGRAPVEEQPESVEELQAKLRKNNHWRDQHIDLKRLHELIGKIRRDYLHAEQEFSAALAGQVTRVEMFFRRLVGELLQTDRVFQIQYEPEELENFIQNLEDYAILNTAILKNVIYFHDSSSMLKLKPSYAWTLRRDDFCQPALLFPLFVRLSAAYHPLPRAPSLPISPSLKRLQTQSNINRGVKVSLWIPPNQVVAFVLQVLKYLPLYDPEQFAVPHTTVYFDDGEFRGYQSCVNPASPEAALTCFRWAKDSITSPEVHIDQKLLEGGKHTTKHIGTLAHSLIGKYLKGGHENDEEFVRAFEAHPGLIPLQKILTTLRPTLKVEHFRTWFGNHHLKIRLCTQLALLRELDQSQLSKLHEWTTPSERIQEQRIHRFPFALVTVRSEALVLPDWLSRLIDKYNRQDRFSTYPHGVAMLYDRLATQYNRPSWLTGPLANVFVQPLFSDDEKTKDQTAAGYFKHTRSDIQMRTELHRARAHSVSEYMRTGSVDFGSPTSAEHRGSDLSAYRSKQTAFRGGGGGDQSMLPPITRTDALVQGSPESKDEQREPEPELQALLPRRPEPVHKPPPPKPPATPAASMGKRAAEHKTYFANERTFMQWFNAAVLLSTVGLALLSSDHYFLRVVAYLFPVIAILVLCYAYRMYRIRIYTLDNQVPTSKFADRQGPCCLTGIVSCLFLAILILMAIHDAAPPYLLHTPPSVGVVFADQATVEPSCNPGFTFPVPMKGIAYNSSMRVLWGVSDSQVFQLFTDSGYTYRFFPQDNILHVGLMGVVIADQPGLIYVGKHAGQILSIDVATKRVVDTWTVEANMSAFTFVGSSQNSSGHFYVANTNSDVVRVYPLPRTKTGSLEMQSSFVPIPSVQLISAFAALPDSSNLLVNSLRPKALVTYEVTDGAAPRLENVLPGFDVREVVSATPFSASQVLVLTGDEELLLYRRDPLTQSYAECLITR